MSEEIPEQTCGERLLNEPAAQPQHSEPQERGKFCNPEKWSPMEIAQWLFKGKPKLVALIRRLNISLDFYKRRCQELQRVQSMMRDPERKMVCDILANGTTYMRKREQMSETTEEQIINEAYRQIGGEAFDLLHFRLNEHKIKSIIGAAIRKIKDASSRVSKMYFDIAVEAIGEDEVRRKVKAVLAQIKEEQ